MADSDPVPYKVLNIAFITLYGTTSDPVPYKVLNIAFITLYGTTSDPVPHKVLNIAFITLYGIISDPVPYKVLNIAFITLNGIIKGSFSADYSCARYKTSITATVFASLRNNMHSRYQNSQYIANINKLQCNR